MAIITHSISTASASNWLYTMDVEGFQSWAEVLAEKAYHEAKDENEEQMIRIARKMIASGWMASERQWRRLQEAYTIREAMILKAERDEANKGAGISKDHYQYHSAEAQAFLMEVVANGAKEGREIMNTLQIALDQFKAEAISEGDDNGFQLWAIAIISHAIQLRINAQRDS